MRISVGISVYVWLHGHKCVRLGLDICDAVDRLDFSKERLFGRERSSLPSAPGTGLERNDDLEIEAAAAHDALHALHARDCLHLRIGRLSYVVPSSVPVPCGNQKKKTKVNLSKNSSKGVLGSDERSLVTICGPLASPLTCNCVEANVGCDLGHLQELHFVSRALHCDAPIPTASGVLDHLRITRTNEHEC
jgi:hypothetical protein